MRKADCFLCGNLADRGGRVSLGAGLALTSDIAPLTDGHLLLHTEDHVGSFAAADPAMLDRWKTKIWEILDNPILTGRPVLVFEHGTDGIEPTEAGCTDHAHIHVMPVPRSPVGRPAPSAAEAVARLGPSFVGPSLPFDELDTLHGTSYFWIADRNLELRTITPGRAERQFLRRVVAEAIERPDHLTWDTFNEVRARVTMGAWREGLRDVDGTQALG